MNRQGILHIPDSKYCFPLDERTLVLRLRLDKRDAIEKVELIYESKYRIQQRQNKLLMEKKYEDRPMRGMRQGWSSPMYGFHISSAYGRMAAVCIILRTD